MNHKPQCESLADRRVPCTCGAKTYTKAEAQANADYYGTSQNRSADVLMTRMPSVQPYVKWLAIVANL